MDAATFQSYATVVAREFGIQLPPAKKALLESRLQRLFSDEPTLSGSDAANFLTALRRDGSGRLLRFLAEAITTHHTYFMREADHFTFYRDMVLPWIEQVATDGDIRTWCAASSTGQEAYTLAMLLEDYFGLKGVRYEKTLLATDLSQEVLDFAERGVYLAEEARKLPQGWLNGYFNRLDALHLQVKDNICRQVLFRQFNLITPSFPFKRPFHVIFCRNVMIYFDTAMRNRLVKLFYDYLEPGGYLFVGLSETVDRMVAPFEYVMPSVYRRPLNDTTRRVMPTISVLAAQHKSASRPAKALADDGKGQQSVNIIALGASTGGTEALATLIAGLTPPLPPIVIVQHIPSGFSRLFAERLNNESRFTVHEVTDGTRLLPNHIYVAPGNKQMRVRRMGEGYIISCRGTELVSGHCPSVDVLFHSVATAAGTRALGAILTGMGSDGADGLLAMRRTGAITLGQDESTSVVYGMPRVAYERGAVARQLPLTAMASAIIGICK